MLTVAHVQPRVVGTDSHFVGLACQIRQHEGEPDEVEVEVEERHGERATEEGGRVQTPEEEVKGTNRRCCHTNLLHTAAEWVRHTRSTTRLCRTDR
jgi:hypothetical protein